MFPGTGSIALGCCLNMAVEDKLRLDSLVSLAAAVFVRLLVSAPLAYAATLLFGLDPLSQRVVVIVCAMPVAVFTTILATEFRANPRFVTNVVVTSTLASTLTLTLVIPMVRSLIGG